MPTITPDIATPHAHTAKAAKAVQGLLCGVLMLSASGTQAAFSLPPKEQWYIGLGLGQSQFDPELNANYRLADEGDVAGKLLVGSMLTPRLSLELGINSLGTVGLTPNGKISYDAYALEGVFYVINGPAYQGHSFNKNFSLFGRFGFNHLNASTLGVKVDDGFQMTFGIGVEQYVQKGIALRGEWQQISDEVSMWTFSLVRRFNHPKSPQASTPVLTMPGQRDTAKRRDQPINTAQNAPIPRPPHAQDTRPLEPAGIAPVTLSAIENPQPIQPAQSDQPREPLSSPEVDIPRQTTPAAAQPLPATPPDSPAARLDSNRDDSDQDGVINYRDVCDQSPSGFSVSRHGCAFTAKRNPLRFEAGSSTLTPAARRWLDSVFDEIQANPQLEFEVHAYTDSQGDELDNLQLSGHRAATVVRYLAQRGVKRARMLPIGQGERNPIADNQSAQGREKNRRVELVLLD